MTDDEQVQEVEASIQITPAERFVLNVAGVAESAVHTEVAAETFRIEIV